MKRVNPFKGLGIALITPFRADGSVDYESLKALVADQLEGGADFLCVMGTTAETPCLSEEEKHGILETVRQVNAGRVPLLLGAGGNCTAHVADYLNSGDIEGVDGVLLVAPYYNKPSQEGLYRHFTTIAASCKWPIVLYNVPGRTGVNMQAETTLRIAQACGNVVAVKEASGNVEQITEVIKGAPEGFEVLSGDDALTYGLMAAGAVGVISVVGNACPRQFGDMVHAVMAGRQEEAAMVNDKFRELYPLMTVNGNPSGVKALLSAMGKIENVLRLPLVPATEGVCQSLGRIARFFQ